MKAETQPFPSPDAGYMPDSEFRRLLGGPSHSTLWRWTRAGLVPPAVKIGPSKNGRKRSDVFEFLADPEAWREKHAPSQKAAA